RKARRGFLPRHRRPKVSPDRKSAASQARPTEAGRLSGSSVPHLASEPEINNLWLFLSPTASHARIPHAPCDVRGRAPLSRSRVVERAQRAGIRTVLAAELSWPQLRVRRDAA